MFPACRLICLQHSRGALRPSKSNEMSDCAAHLQRRSAKFKVTCIYKYYDMVKKLLYHQHTPLHYHKITGV